MKSIFLFILLASTTILSGQKNVVPVTKSDLTGIALPAGTKKDTRILSTAGAKMLLQLESDKAGATLSTIEVLLLPSVSQGGFNKDSVTLKLSVLGWKILPVQGDEKFSWLQKDKRSVISYLSVDAKSTSLYFSEASIPVAQKPEIAEPKPTPVTAPVTTLSTPSNTSTPKIPQTSPAPAATNPQPPALVESTGYTFTTTNFDDGWAGTVKEDWVQVVKGNITVFLHFPTKAIDVSSYDYKTIAVNAWNTLVAPRYSNLQNFLVFSGTLDYERPYYISGDVTDNATGKKEHVVLFKKGDSGWIEIIVPDKNSFVQSFGVDISKVDYYADPSIWDLLRKMAGYNRFAVAPGDIRGKWTSNFTGMQQYVNAYTGANAGMDTYSSSQTFEFDTGGNYKWELSVASGFVGSIKFQNVKSTGKSDLPNNWQICFSDLEGKPKTYNAYFSCIKGARILWLEDTSYPTGYTGYGKM